MSVVSVLLKMLTYSVYDFLRGRECLNIEVLRRRPTHKFADSLALPQNCGLLFRRSLDEPLSVQVPSLCINLLVGVLN